MSKTYLLSKDYYGEELADIERMSMKHLTNKSHPKPK